MDPTKATIRPSVSHTETRKRMAEHGDFPCCAGRGDATPNPAMIGRAVEVARAAVKQAMRTPTTDLIGPAVRAAVAVIVADTAEAIAAAIEAMYPHEYTLAELKAEGFGDDLGVIYRDARGNAARRARSFAAGLSAGATTGDGDVHE